MCSDRARVRARAAPRSGFALEALEPRLLLSADAIGTAVQALLPPDPSDAALAAAYAGAPREALAGPQPFSDPATVLSADFSDASINLVNSLRIIGSVTLTATSGNASIGNDSTDYVGGNSAVTDAAWQFTRGELLADEAWGLAVRLEKAWLLGAADRQPAASGASTSAERFDFWEDSLVL